MSTVEKSVWRERESEKRMIGSALYHILDVDDAKSLQLLIDISWINHIIDNLDLDGSLDKEKTLIIKKKFEDAKYNKMVKILKDNDFNAIAMAISALDNSLKEIKEIYSNMRPLNNSQSFEPGVF